MSNKICFISIGNIYNVPYLTFYLDIVGDNDYDIIYWDRELLDEKTQAVNTYRFDFQVSNKMDKMRGYINFSNFCRKIVKSNKYQKIVFLQTLGSILNTQLIRKMKAEFILDIRDYSYEQNPIIFKIENYIIKKAKMVLISSPAFKTFLPKNIEYLEIHNLQKINRENFNLSKAEIVKYPIKLAYIGKIIYIKENLKLINYFANDPRFSLLFAGSGTEQLKEYCLLNNISNVKFVGRFKPEETINFYRNIDIIINTYGNNNPCLDYALSNKLYYATMLHLPILVNQNTYMETISKSLNIGVTLHYKVEDKEKIIDFMDDFAEIDLNKLEDFNKKVIECNILTRSKVEQFLLQ